MNKSIFIWFIVVVWCSIFFKDSCCILIPLDLLVCIDLKITQNQNAFFNLHHFQPMKGLYFVFVGPRRIRNISIFNVFIASFTAFCKDFWVMNYNFLITCILLMVEFFHLATRSFLYERNINVKCFSFF